MLKKGLLVLVVTGLSLGGYALGYLGIGKEEVAGMLAGDQGGNGQESQDKGPGDKAGNAPETGGDGNEETDEDKVSFNILERSLVDPGQPVSLLTGIFSERKNAEDHMRNLEDYPVELIEAVDSNDNDWYLVLLGEFASEEDAWLLQNELISQRQINAYFVNKPAPPAKE